MAGIENKIGFYDGIKLQPSTAQDLLNLQEAATDVGLINYAGNPENNVSANPSALSHDYSTGNIYYKSTGTGNTGWKLLNGVASLTLTGDTGGALSATGGNWNIIGQKAGTLAVVDTIGNVSTISIEDRTWISSLVVDPSSTSGLRGTFTTITAALTAAVSGQTIYVRPGTYVENLTLKAGVDICAMTGDGYSNTVAIDGSISASYAGRATISGCQLISRNSDGITISGASATVLTVKDCVLSQAANAGTHYSLVMSAASGELYIFDCFGSTTTNGSWINMTAGLAKIVNCNLANNGGTTLNNLVSGGTLTIIASAIGTDATVGAGFTVSAGVLTALNSNFSGQITSSGTGDINLENSRIYTPNSTCLTSGSSGGDECMNCVLVGGTASAISVGSTLLLSNCSVNSSNTNAITGAGTLSFGGIVFTGTSSLINTSTQIPLVQSNDAIRITTPGAYPYTTVPQDQLILVDTSLARTITPLASPTTGQKHIIKDNVGSAATNNITITPSGKNIDGAASTIINLNYGSVTIVYNGTQWLII